MAAERPNQVETLILKAAVRQRDGMRCTKCGLTNEEHKARYKGKSLHVHRTTPGSAYTMEGCITLCFVCHAPEPKRARGEVKKLSNSVTVRIRGALVGPAETAAEQSCQPWSHFVNDAVRMRLEAEGLWPPQR